MRIRFILVYITLLLFVSLPADAQTPLSPQESRGKEIYLLGTSKSGKEILAYLGDASLELPGSTMACANCHGLTGQGKPEGGLDPSNITWEALTKPYGVTHTSGRKHPPYTPRALEFAITRGLDPAGNKLLAAMPRYQMSKQDLDDLILYLKRLGTDVDPGISDNQITIGTVLPATGPLAEIGQAVKEVLTAYFAEVNLQGGIYNRRLELKTVETGSTAAGTRANIERLIKDEKVFAMAGAFLAGAERELAPVFAQWEVPVIGPLSLDPQPGNPVNRQVFYLLSGNAGQARALVSMFAKKPEIVEGGLAIIYHRTDLSASVLEAVRNQCEKESLRVPVIYEYLPGKTDALESVRQVKPKPPAAIFFLGLGTELSEFMEQAAKVNWFPVILLQTGGVNASIFDAPAGFAGKIFSTVPMSPHNQTTEALREFGALAERYKLPQTHRTAQVTALGAAKVLVEALKRAGKELSREKLIQTLEGFYEFQTGLTPAITYGPNRRIGALGAHIVMVDLKEKKFVPAGGWVGVN